MIQKIVYYYLKSKKLFGNIEEIKGQSHLNNFFVTLIITVAFQMRIKISFEEPFDGVLNNGDLI